jgi:hypothetical protein
MNTPDIGESIKNSSLFNYFRAKRRKTQAFKRKLPKHKNNSGENKKDDY